MNADEHNQWELEQQQQLATKKTGLDLLREPFSAAQISKLPKPTKQQTEAVKIDFKQGVRCDICGGWHHPKVVHLDYVGHAALTNRLLDSDPDWVWEPLAFDEKGLPVLDNDGGLWIKLTVCGITRLGYGDAQGKTGGDAMKERIGDALRNAAMRFGAALDLWHKGNLHDDEPEIPEKKAAQSPKCMPYPQKKFEANMESWKKLVADGKSTPDGIIRKIGSTYILSSKQIAEINAIGNEDFYEGYEKGGQNNANS